ncbi:uncharacterized protein LTR77_011258 [Saxophila tyrrhenica]|uniref:Uncharacterized protein n=1 Tax=Saxophila tyrrhenica TaxID=1690608 RepID=A0AAV9NSZ5_9PEZI|nr:hypothetical protein LTR77_011258 [Saxophila tyrrhenica]
MQSGYFNTACKEGRWKEGSTDVITLKAASDVIEGDDPSIVDLMITFLYENDYQPRLDQIALSIDEHHQDEGPGIAIEVPDSESTSNEVQGPIDHGNPMEVGKGKKAKGKKNKYASLRAQDLSEDINAPAARPTNAESFLPVHAKVFALGSKYDIPHLQSRSIAKFKATACLWSKDELTEAISIAFNTAPDNNGLRVAI